MRYQLAALFLLLPLAALAQPAPDPAAPNPDQQAAPKVENATVNGQKDADAPKPVKMICVRAPAETGSHMGARRECHTQEEWDMMHRQSEATVQRYHDQTMLKSPDPSAGR
jgi:hypothetical protein